MSIRIATDAEPMDGSRAASVARHPAVRNPRDAQRPRAPSQQGRTSRGSKAERGEREAHLIFRLAGYAGANGDQPLGAATDWTKLLQIAWDEGAVGALRDHCSNLPAGTVPLDVERRLACLVLDRELRMRILEKRTSESLAALQAAGIEVGLLKGAALAATIYGSFAARPMKDVDLLVHPTRAEDAKQVMLRSGWSRDHALPDESTYHAHHHLAPLVDSAGSRCRLELHRTLLPTGHPFALPIGELWAGMQLADLRGHPVSVLDPTHHAVHIAVHFAWSHTLRSGAWHAFRDLGAMQRAGMIDWSQLVDVARKARAATCCYWTLRLAQTMTDLDVPDGVLPALAPVASGASLDRMERHFVNVLLRHDSAHLSLRLDRAIWTMAMQPREQGHGVIRPWLVSADLTAARLRGEPAVPGQRPLRRVDRVARCTAYIARLLWS